MIEVENLTRVFRTYKKKPGFWGGVKGLVKRDFEETRAADNVSFSIKEGELVGFLGPNGAGKTTTLKMLSGLIYPTSGTARVAGFDPSKREDAYRRLFALVLGQKNQLWWDLPAVESFHLIRAIYGLPPVEFKAALDELVELLGIGPKLNVMVRELSLGERMKMELIAALLHRPRVLFLDEPTIGLDVISQKAVRGFLRDYNRRYRTTILLTSHYMADISSLCERVIVIDHGKKIYDGDLDAIAGAGARQRIIRFRPRLALSGVDGPALSEAEGKPAPFGPDWKPLHGVSKAGEDGELVLHVPSEHVTTVCSQILAHGAVDDITIQDVPLEDIISELFSRGVPAAR